MKVRLGTILVAVATAIVCGESALAELPPNASETVTNAAAATEARTYVGRKGEPLNYRIYAPEKTEAGRRYPLVLFLHGAGSRGDDNARQLHWGWPIVLYMKAKGLDAYLIAPQCPKGKQWVDTPWGLLAHKMPDCPSEPMSLVIELLEKTIRDMPVDASRVYVTGLSMGGYGTWDIVQRRPELFAAAIPVCGGGDSSLAWKIRSVPIWTFHGDKDDEVPVARSRQMVSALWQCDGNIRYREYPGVGHGCWIPTYNDHTVLDWLFAQKLQSPVKAARPVPRPALAARLAEGPEIIGIVHLGLNTYTDREWGFGDEDPAMLNPSKFDADQIVGACKAGGIGGLVVVAKHHDGFCLWPTKTTEHNITKTPFWRGTGNGERGTGRDYVKEMEQACRRAGVKFGVYCSPWDRNNAHYGTEKYVTDVFQQQLRELLSGNYGEIFEMWFDGANGGDGYYGGAREKRQIPNGYYRYDTETFAMVRKLQPKVAIFSGAEDDSDLRWPGNEQGLLDPDSRATVCTVGGFVNRKYGNPEYYVQNNTGSSDGDFFRVCEADFPLRKGWFYHESECGTTRSAAYLTKLYLSSVGNAGVMNIGIAPNKDGLLDADDVKALAGFKTLKDALFAHEAKPGEAFNVVVMREDISKGEQVDEWEFVVDGKAILRGKSIGLKRIRVLETPCTAKSCEVKVLKDGGTLQGVSFKLYRADPELVRLVLSATTESGETDTAKWMTAEQ